MADGYGRDNQGRRQDGGRGRRGIRAGRPLRQDSNDDDDYDDEGLGNREGRGHHGNHDEHERRGQPNFRGGREGGRGRGNRDGGGGRQGGDRPRILGFKMLEQLQERDPSHIVLTLAHPKSGLRDALMLSATKTDLVGLLLNVLAKAFSCNSALDNLSRIFTIIKETLFFDAAMVYFLEMQTEVSAYKKDRFKQPIKDMISIMEELMAKHPTSVTQFVGIHGVLQVVIDALRSDTNTVIDDEILESFRKFTELKEKLLNKNKRKPNPTPEDREREQDLAGPPDDFRNIAIFPETADMQTNDDRYLRANKMKGRYDDLDHYLDVQFRLLREDFVAPLREGISSYIQAVEETGRKTRKLQDVRIYHNVKIIAPECGDSGLLHVLQFDVSRLGKVRWKISKRLIFGSLVCLSPDNFKSFFFATVTNREPKDLERGLVKVQFEVDHTVIKTLFGQLYTMAETTAYFESYRHVLSGLQKTRVGDLPFEKYIIKCGKEVSPPAYLRDNDTFDLRPLVDEDVILKGDTRLENLGELVVAERNYEFSDRSETAKDVTMLARDMWPPADLLHLDDSQYRAIHTALTKEFVITQGPPGTGKTYIGLKIVKALLHNRKAWSKHPATGAPDQRPMLVVCYTNHALDQFLEGIVSFFKGDVLRVGGRSKSEVLKDYNLHNFRQRFRHAQKVPVAVFQGRREAKSEMNRLTGVINKIGAKIQVASTGILHEDFLQPFIGPYHYQLLIQQFEMMIQVYPDARQVIGRRGFSVVVEWLGLGDLAPIVEMEGNMGPAFGQQAVPGERDEEADDDLIDVENEIDAIQAQRRLVHEEDDDDDEDDDFFRNIQLPGDFEDLTPKQLNEIRVQVAYTEQMKSVALNVFEMDNKPKGMYQGEWQIQKKQRKKLKRDIQRNLSSTDTMTEEEARNVHDMWRLLMVDKWRLYRFWIRKYCDHLLKEISDKEDEFDAAAGRYREALMQEDKEVMKQSTVIGMTTTGAARYQSVLQEIRPRIIVVEEAAEVLEAHIITTLSRGCEHLILIGDHKQLKPNPTVYKLATDYNLDVSLFERMIANGIKCDCLELQHRMRPEIAELMHHIYDNFRDHDDVKTYENIKGVSTDMFFINHNNAETHDEDLRSHSNEFEAQYIVGLCNYLLLQGYKPDQITVLTLYSGQLFCIRNLMPKERYEGVKVTVVDNYQGEENDIVLLSLVRSNEEGSIGFLKIDNRVCVALSRAKMGFYVIGNFDLLSAKSDLWNEITIDMKKKKRMGDGLVLYCQNHQDMDGIVVKKPSDFDGAPEGGCNRKCDFRLPCGHGCKMFCHVKDSEHNEYTCSRECGKIVCKNNHRCTKRCFEPCGDCVQKVPKRIPRCGHTQQVPCHMHPENFCCKEKCKEKLPCKHDCQASCGSAHTENCKATVDKTWPCGHEGKIFCYQKNEALCPNPCGTPLGCEHLCTGTCGKCFQGRLHQPCRNDCNRNLVCGHACTDMCNQCPPCTRKCENKCKHSKCGKRCGELCAPCMEPCEWKCEHHRCRMLCSEPCDRPKCNKPCKKRLPCKHACIGLCGEPCPTDCRICDKEKVTEMLFGDEDEPNSHFVLLQDCRARCIIESKAMDAYMDQKDDSERGEIMLKSCPKCRTPIRKSNRYGTQINRSLQDIESVKKTVLTNKERIRKLEDDIREEIAEEKPSIKLLFKRRLVVMGNPKSENTLAAMKNQLTFLKAIRALEDEWKKLKGIAYIDEKNKGLKFLEHFRDWLLEERTIMTSQETADAELEVSRSQAHIKLLMHQQKIQETRTVIEAKLKFDIREVERILLGSGKYNEANRVKVEKCLEELKKKVPLSGFGISEDERLMIVSAMYLPKGHWYKCPKGHVYAIGDCGGASEVGRCPECKASIGGTGHRLIADNAVAEEMDGARHAAWSEQANLENYGFNIIH